MVNDIRIKTCRIPESGVLSMNTSGTLVSKFSDVCINGTIQSVYAKYNNTTATGSLFLRESGSDIQILKINGFSPSVEAYPRVICTDSNNTALDGVSGTNIYTNRVLNNKIYVNGSGFGSGNTISYVELRYM